MRGEEKKKGQKRRQKKQKTRKEVEKRSRRFGVEFFEILLFFSVIFFLSTTHLRVLVGHARAQGLHNGHGGEVLRGDELNAGPV